jgi:hypothetical protein
MLREGLRRGSSTRVQARGFMNKQHITRRQKDDVYKKMNTKFDQLKIIFLNIYY